MFAHLVGLSVLPWPCRGQTHARKHTRVPGHLLGSKVVEGQGLRSGPNRRFCLSPALGVAGRYLRSKVRLRAEFHDKTPLVLDSSTLGGSFDHPSGV